MVSEERMETEPATTSHNNSGKYLRTVRKRHRYDGGHSHSHNGLPSATRGLWHLGLPRGINEATLFFHLPHVLISQWQWWPMAMVGVLSLIVGALNY